MDIKCVVCGEPWDAYGVNHGDMLEWERVLFRQGAGCPGCKGVVPANRFHPESIADIENGDEDPMIRLNAYEDSIEGRAPKWERPEPKVFWTCDGCDVQVIGNPDYREEHEDYLEYHLPRDARGNKWWHSHPYDRGMPEKEPAHKFGDQNVCEFCLDHCEGCGAPVSSLIETSDVYDEGWCITLEGYGYQDVFCITCVESVCSECDCLPDDCECRGEQEGEDFDE